MDHETLKAQLIESDSHFRSLHDKHQACDKELDELTRRAFLSDDDQLHEVELKKKKLRIKEQMEDLLRKHSNQTEH